MEHAEFEPHRRFSIADRSDTLGSKLQGRQRETGFSRQPFAGPAGVARQRGGSRLHRNRYFLRIVNAYQLSAKHRINLLIHRYFRCRAVNQ
jgi:hypothetical protein